MRGLPVILNFPGEIRKTSQNYAESSLYKPLALLLFGCAIQSTLNISKLILIQHSKQLISQSIFFVPENLLCDRRRMRYCNVNKSNCVKTIFFDSGGYVKISVLRYQELTICFRISGILQTGPQVIKLFSCSTQLSMKF